MLDYKELQTIMLKQLDDGIARAKLSKDIQLERQLLSARQTYTSYLEWAVNNPLDIEALSTKLHPAILFTISKIAPPPDKIDNTIAAAHVLACMGYYFGKLGREF